MIPSPQHRSLSADRPIQKRASDLLGRSTFATALADSLAHWRGDESIVIALYGRWGSGKSSVKNMIQDALHEHKKPPQVVEFNPWAWAAQGFLFHAFFRELGLTLQHETPQKAVKQWTQYAERLGHNGNAMKGLPLSEFKKALSAALSQRQSALLVVMDDVDRLPSKDIRLLFQLVKVNADFPNVIYLMLFDRSVVERALSEDTLISGREYLEKIVQAGFDLPMPSGESLQKVFLDGLDDVLPSDCRRGFDYERWGLIFPRVVRPFLRHLRDIKRLLSCLAFTSALFRKQDVFEANTIDLIAIECIRLFEPEVYIQLPLYRRELLGLEIWSAGNDEMEKRRKRLESLIAVATAEHQDAIRHLIYYVFPSSPLLGSSSGDGTWIRDLRACCDDFFDRYFSFALAQGELPQSVIDDILASASSRPALVEKFTALNSQGMLPRLLDRLEGYFDSIQPDQIEPVVTAVMDISDPLPTYGSSFFDLGPYSQAGRVVFQLLKREKTLEKRSRIFLSAMRATTAIRLPVHDTMNQDSRESRGHGIELALLDEEGIRKAKQLCVKKIRSAANSGTPMGQDLATYLWCWSKWGKKGEADSYVRRLLRTPQGALALLDGFVGEVRQEKRNGIVSRRELNPKVLEEFISLDRMKKALRPVLRKDRDNNAAHLYAANREILSAFNRAIARRKKGIPDDAGFRIHPDDTEAVQDEQKSDS